MNPFHTYHNTHFISIKLSIKRGPFTKLPVYLQFLCQHINQITKFRQLPILFNDTVSYLNLLTVHTLTLQAFTIPTLLFQNPMCFCSCLFVSILSTLSTYVFIYQRFLQSLLCHHIIATDLQFTVYKQYCTSPSFNAPSIRECSTQLPYIEFLHHLEFNFVQLVFRHGIQLKFFFKVEC